VSLMCQNHRQPKPRSHFLILMYVSLEPFTYAEKLHSLLHTGYAIVP